MTQYLPDDHEEITERIMRNCKSLIKLNYWDSIKNSELYSWVENFNDGEEKYLASVILDHVIFRNNEAVNAFAAQLFHVQLPKILEDKNIYHIKDIESWMFDLDSLQARSKLPVRFSTIEGVDTKTGKSGQILIREIQRKYFDKELNFSIATLASPEFQKKAKDKVRCIVILDDILCTGTQLDTFMKKYDVEYSPFYFIYCPLAAMQESVETINKKYSNIHVEPIEFINADNYFFNEDNSLLNIMRPDGYLHFQNVYLDICKKLNNKMKEPLGFGDKGLTYFFKHSTPNNNLALLTYKTNVWKSLVVR